MILIKTEEGVSPPKNIYKKIFKKNIFNLSFEKSELPSFWKTSHTIPLHKKGPKTNPSIYRPVGIIKEFTKVQEKLVHKRLLSFLDKFNLDKFN